MSVSIQSKITDLNITEEDIANMFSAGRKRKATFYSNVVSVLESKDHVPQYPVKLLWEIHSRCHLNCEHCWAATNSGVNKPPLDVQLRRAKEFAEKGGVEVSFSGGEPLLSDRLEPLIRQLTGDGVSCQILTNGELLKSELGWILETMGTGDRIQISIDGPESVHEAQRPGSDFRRLEKGVEAVTGTNIHVSAHFTATPINLDSLDQTIEWCIKRGFDHLSISPVYPTPYDSGADLWERFNELEYVEVVADCLRRYDFDIDIFLPIQLFEVLPPSSLPDRQIDEPMRLEAGTTHMQIQADGKVYPGSRFVYPEFCNGTIEEQTIHELWNTDNQLWKDLRNGRDLTDTKCGDCRWAGYCAGGSTRLSYRFFDTIHRPDPFCRHTPERGEQTIEPRYNSE